VYFASRRSPLTLVEVLLVIALMSLLVGTVGWNVRKLYLQQAFSQEVESVADLLNVAQEFGIVGIDCSVVIKAGQNNTLQAS